MRKLHEQLKLLGNARACDRYPYLKELTGLDKKLRANWDAYDTYIPADNNPPTGENTPDSEASTGTAPGTVTPAAGNESPEPPAATPDPEVPTGTAPETVNPTAGKESPEPPADARAISAARKYLSLNKRKLAELRKMEDQSKYLKLLDAMRKRLDLLIQSKAGISPEQLTELTNLGLDG
jgi:hypothetical protein